MGSTKLKNIYEVHVSGQYYAYAEGEKDIKPYEFTFKADDEVKKNGLLSSFRNALTPKDGEASVILDAMREKYRDYKRFRTMEIKSVVNLTEKKKPVRELALMNRAQIIRYIDKKGFHIDCWLYRTVPQLRQALRDYRDHKEVFLERQEKLKAIHGDDIKVRLTLDELNKPELENADVKALNHALAAEFDPETNIIDDSTTNDMEVGIDLYDQEDELDAIISGV